MTKFVQTQSRTKHFLCQRNVAAFYRDKFLLVLKLKMLNSSKLNTNTGSDRRYSTESPQSKGLSKSMKFFQNLDHFIVNCFLQQNDHFASCSFPKPEKSKRFHTNTFQVEACTKKTKTTNDVLWHCFFPTASHNTEATLIATSTKIH